MQTRSFFYALFFLLCLSSPFISCHQPAGKAPAISLTLVPPTTVTDKINLDIRAGITNLDSVNAELEVSFYLDKDEKDNLLHTVNITIPGDSSQTVKFVMPTSDHVGDREVIVVVKGNGINVRSTKKISIVSSATRSDKKIGGAWISFYHWSETEGKMWNPIIKDLTDAQWKEMIADMHSVGMDIIIIQESFRNQAYVGDHKIEEEGYQGKAFYPSKLYPERMPLKATDPVEAVLAQADESGMHVFMGVGMYAWFDYTAGSLEWHKKVAKELWDLYGHHPSFYGFYVSEEGMGSLDCFEKDSSKHDMRRQEVLNFFREFTPFCNRLAPGKPVMFAPNGWGVGRSKGAYPELLKNVDIISPFAFARMPEGDLTGPEAIRRLQQYCDDAKAHLWLDLEAFVFDEKEGYLVPRPIKDIEDDLNLFDNFEKVNCYQYPGVFNSPNASVRVGEASTVELYKDYQNYLKKLDSIKANSATK
jgi:hypothetical protein